MCRCPVGLGANRVTVGWGAGTWEVLVVAEGEALRVDMGGKGRKLFRVDCQETVKPRSVVESALKLWVMVGSLMATRMRANVDTNDGSAWQGDGSLHS